MPLLEMSRMRWNPLTLLIYTESTPIGCWVCNFIDCHTAPLDFSYILCHNHCCLIVINQRALVNIVFAMFGDDEHDWLGDWVYGYYSSPRIACHCCFFSIAVITGINFICKSSATNIQLNFPFHDQKMWVQRVWFTLVILPSFNILSHTLTKTWNFCSRVRVSAPSHFAIMRVICALDLIICFENVCQ